ncbi:MAG: hypothetical protein KGJ07_03185 [Patescibacteria group bacterium]|nr:hypothetical protein [Patescibacteria group bacterium]MDE2588146.1 hypothetical protein [Patescibacteria group bacterium]
MTEQEGTDIFAHIAADERLANLIDHAERSENCPTQDTIRQTTLESMTSLLKTSLEIAGVDGKLQTDALVEIGVRQAVGAGQFTPEMFMDYMERNLMGVAMRMDGAAHWIESDSEAMAVHQPKTNDFWHAKEITDLYTQLVMDSGFDTPQGSFSDYLTEFIDRQTISSDPSVLRQFKGYVGGRLMEELYILTMSNVHQGLQGFERALNHRIDIQHLPDPEKELPSYETLFRHSSELLQAFDFSTKAFINAGNARVPDAQIPLTNLISRRMVKFPSQMNRLTENLQVYGNSMQTIRNTIRPAV